MRSRDEASRAILSRRLLARDKKPNPGVPAHLVFGYGRVIAVVDRIVAVERLIPGPRADAKHDGIVQLRKTDARLVLVSNLPGV